MSPEDRDFIARHVMTKLIGFRDEEFKEFKAYIDEQIKKLDLENIVMNRPMTNSAGPRTRLGEMVDVVLENLAVNQSIKWDGNNWVPFTPEGADAVSSVNGKVGAVVLDTGDIAEVTNKKYVTDAEKTVIGNTSGTNTGDNATNTQYSGLAASKENSISAGTTGQYWRGDKSWQTLDKTAVGLGNVDNTSDATKDAATATLTNKTLSAPTITGNTTHTGGIPTIGGDGTNAGAIQLQPANPAYNWYTLVNKDAGAAEGFAIQSGAYPSVVVTPFACTRAGAMTTPLGAVSQLGYERLLNGAGSSTTAMSASTTYYFGNFATQFFPTTGATTNRVYSPRTGTIKRASVIFRTGSGTVSSAETVALYVRVDNTTDYTLATDFRTDVANSIYFNDLAVNIPFAAGSYLNIKMVTPAWSVVANYPYVEVRLYIE
jgi:hypothetical protein